MANYVMSSIEDIERYEAVDWNDLGIPATTLDVIHRGGQGCQSRTALVFVPNATVPEHWFSWPHPEFIRPIEATGRLFEELVTAELRSIALLIPNLPETHFALWGGQDVGRVVPINPLLEPARIENLLTASEANLLVTLASLPGVDLFDKAVEAIAQSGLDILVITVNPAKYLRGPKAWIGQAYHRLSKGGASRCVVRCDKAIDPHLGLAPRSQPTADDVAAVFHAGGTTGLPKLAPLSHANLVSNAWMTSRGHDAEILQLVFSGLPLFHMNGVQVTGLSVWMPGSTSVLGPPEGYRTPGAVDNLRRIVAHHRINVMSGIPSLYQRLLEVPINSVDISCLKEAFCGAAPLSGDLLSRFEERAGVKLLEGYGFTEGVGVTCTNPKHGERRTGSVGIRLPYRDVAIFDTSLGEATAVPAEATGSVCVRDPNVFHAYVGRDKKTSGFVPDPDGGVPWCHIGDLGRMDEQCHLWLIGRQKELIIRGGHNIDPAIIEEALSSHPAIAMAAAVAATDPNLGEIPVAYVTCMPETTISESKLLEWRNAQLPERATIPQRIEIVANLPLTAIGKVFKPELKRIEIKRAIQRALTDFDLIETLNVTSRADPAIGETFLITVRTAADRSDVEQSIAQRLSGYAFDWNLEVKRNVKMHGLPRKKNNSRSSMPFYGCCVSAMALIAGRRED